MFKTVFSPGRTAIVTGAASGIGRATCHKLAALGMRIIMADMESDDLEDAFADVSKSAPDGEASVRSIAVDIARGDGIPRLKAAASDDFADVAFLFNNAVIREKAGTWDGAEIWRRMLDVNFFAVQAAVQAFVPDMIASEKPGMIVNAGSKQGITSPPGNSPYNVAKSALKTYTELLQHDLRNTEGSNVSAHLLIPGMTNTGKREPRPGGWSSEQVVDFMLAALAAGDFYILCPDGEVTLEMDQQRIRWAADDVAENRPPLSRWHPDWAEKFTTSS